MIFVVSLLAVAVLVAVHLFSYKLRFLDGTPRSIWLSLAGGVSVAYVFVHLLPELAEGQEAIAEAAGEGFSFLEQHVYLVALVGLATFYGLDRLATESRRRRRKAGGEDSTEAGVFWIHIGSFAVYNVLTGYLLLNRLATGLEALVLFALAMALHFVVNDYGLREQHKGLYTRIGRWVISAAILIGWAIGLAIEVPEAAVATLTAFLAGGVIMNILKEELPEERQSRFWAFAAGAAAYAALLLVAF
ncbi:hypothetical protein GBA65_02715 [Rubrobacter marinus]|uniref:ZIP Zinc transporter n=1 Tax=Rubrobacter marinus TaxID=2653852 RepID=A0A6G8PSY2_9ACTN|nr:hypothetical protein [Rubrobacter marinus]QIN77599.1 hypothetical protein GBA65_02715 [Rubrobacter marinus]